MKDLYKIIINDREYEELIEYENTLVGYNKDSLFFEGLVEKNLNYEKDNMFYYDVEKFMKENVEITLIETDVKRKIFLLVTGVTGYDTYDSAIITAYTPEDAKEYGYNNLASYFLEATVELVGVVSNTEYDKKNETLVASFRNG